MGAATTETLTIISPSWNNTPTKAKTSAKTCLDYVTASNKDTAYIMVKWPP